MHAKWVIGLMLALLLTARAGGGVAALAVHPADDYVATHIVGNDAADKFFKPGQIIGGTAFK